VSIVDGLIDGLLACVLLVLAVRVLTVANPFHAVVVFISFGLLMALTWVRLAAPDVALAEAGIGAALTGVLLIEVLHRLSWQQPADMHEDQFKPSLRRGGDWPVYISCGLSSALLAALLIHVVVSADGNGGAMAEHVAANLDVAGATHPVTAVLLDFRSLDTLLELVVLFLATLGMFAVRRTQPEIYRVTAPVVRDAAVDTLPKLLLPLLVMAAGFLLWLGSFTAGGAFQSGIVLAAAAVLLSLTGRSLDAVPTWVWHGALVCGIAALVIFGTALRIAGRAWLDYPPDWAGDAVLVLELAAAVTIGTALALLFLGLSAPDRSPITMRDDA
jgi:multisubunit Na+/H+ antiporter MnhB subunit